MILFSLKLIYQTVLKPSNNSQHFSQSDFHIAACKGYRKNNRVAIILALTAESSRMTQQNMNSTHVSKNGAHACLWHAKPRWYREEPVHHGRTEFRSKLDRKILIVPDVHASFGEVCIFKVAGIINVAIHQNHRVCRLDGRADRTINGTRCARALVKW